MNKIHLCTLAVLTSLSFSSLAKDCDASLLPSWKDSDSKTAIVNFVEQSTDSSKAT
ncbi:haloacid dehalogenase-like hydrolase, partial [Vibrio sp. 399]|nr:haloacid dehalogenase-like hydrolase [Vibrio sp. 399]